MLTAVSLSSGLVSRLFLGSLDLGSTGLGLAKMAVVTSLANGLYYHVSGPGKTVATYLDNNF